MILTDSRNLSAYASLNPHFPAAFAALQQQVMVPFEKGRLEVDDDTVFLVGLEYDTHPAEGALMEAHHKYIDVMWLVSGREQIAVCPIEWLTDITQPYNAAGDALLATMPDNCMYAQMAPGRVCILFPEDAHGPGLDAERQAHVQKLIAKVRVD